MPAMQGGSQSEPVQEMARCVDCQNCQARHCVAPLRAFGYAPRNGRIELSRNLAVMWQRCAGFKARKQWVNISKA